MPLSSEPRPYNAMFSATDNVVGGWVNVAAVALRDDDPVPVCGTST
jgi:hypothetical protein